MGENNETKVDMHVHSDECDGAGKEEIVNEAFHHNVRAIALTDHQITDGIDKVAGLARQKNISLEVVPAVEVSTMEGFDIVLYMIDHSNAHLQEELHRIRQGRQIRAQKMAQKLDMYFSELLGIRVPYNEVIQLTTNGNIAGGHFEKYIYNQFRKAAEQDHNEYLRLMERWVGQINNDNPDEHVFFDRNRDIKDCVDFIKEELVRTYLLKGGKPCHVKRTLNDCLAAEATGTLGREAFGLVCVAHPGGTNKDGALMGVIEKSQADCLEVMSSKHTPDQNRKYAEMARELGIIPTGGTDWHGKEYTPRLQIGDVHYTTQEGVVVRPTYKMVDAMRQRKEMKYRS